MDARCILATACATALLGCAAKDRYREPRNALERALSFREISRDEEDIPMGRDGQKVVTGVPTPASVDIESVIEISLDKTKLHEAAGLGTDAGDLRDLKERAERLRKAADAALGCMQKQQQLLREFRELDAEPADSAAVRAFVDRLEAADRAEAEVLAVITTEYDRATADRVDTRMRNRRGLLAVSEFLQEEAVVLERRQREISDRLAAAQLSLRLSAYLDSPGREPVKVRLPGYDSLPEGHIVPVSRNGLPLTAADQKALQDAWQATVAMSSAMQRFAEGEAEVRELLMAATPMLSKRLGEALAAVEQIVRDVKDPAFAAALERVRTDMPRFLARLREAAGAAGADALEGVVEALEKLGSDQQQLAAVLGSEELVALVVRGKELVDRWRDVRPAQLVALGLDSIAFASDLDAARKKFDKQKALAKLEELVKQELGTVVASVRDALLAVPADFSELQKAFDEAVDVVGSGRRVVKALADLFANTKSGAQPLAHTPESFEVPVEDAAGTCIDLLQVPRREGDVVRLRATVSRGGKVLHEGEAGFRVETFGWRGKLSPSVVLTRPNEIAGEETFQFAPVLSWLHGYHARPTESDFFIDLNRLLQPALGIHAGFLNFDPAEEVEIGLGGTLSLWDGRLQFGAGCNLMAEDEDQGRYYWFVGSDLISLLQTIGLAEP